MLLIHAILGLIMTALTHCAPTTLQRFGQPINMAAENHNDESNPLTGPYSPSFFIGIMPAGIDQFSKPYMFIKIMNEMPDSSAQTSTQSRSLPKEVGVANFENNSPTSVLVKLDENSLKTGQLDVLPIADNPAVIQQAQLPRQMQQPLNQAPAVQALPSHVAAPQVTGSTLQNPQRQNMIMSAVAGPLNPLYNVQQTPASAAIQTQQYIEQPQTASDNRRQQRNNNQLQQQQQQLTSQGVNEEALQQLLASALLTELTNQLNDASAMHNIASAIQHA